MADVVAVYRKRGNLETWLKRLLWIIIILLFIFCLVELGFHLLIAPHILLKNIVIKTDLPLKKESILSIAGIEGNEYYFLLNTEEMQKNLESYPLIKRAIISKQFPDTLEIALQGREALASALLQAGEKSVPVVFDEQGVIFQIGKTVDQYKLPVISGLIFKSVDLGTRLPEILLPLLGDLKELRENNSELFDLISEIKIIPQGSDEFETVFYPITNSIRVRMGQRINANSLNNMLIMLQIMEQQGVADRVYEVDFRTGDFIYTD